MDLCPHSPCSGEELLLAAFDSLEDSSSVTSGSTYITSGKHRLHLASSSTRAHRVKADIP